MRLDLRPLAAALLWGAAAGLAGCAGPLGRIETSCDLFPRVARCTPSPTVAHALLPDADAGDEDYNRHFLALLASDRLGRLDRANGTGKFGRDFHTVANSGFQAEYRALSQAAKETKTAHVAAAQHGEGASSGTFGAKWRVSRQTLFIDPEAQSSGEFQFSGLQARSVEIRIAQIGSAPVEIAGRCDGPAALGGSTGDRRLASGEAFRLRLQKSGETGDSASLFPGPALERCDLIVRSVKAPNGRRLTIRREETADPGLAAFDSLYQRCASPDPVSLPPLDRVFYASRWLSQTCPVPLGRPNLLLDERDGFNAKVEALAGRRLPDSFFDRGDPEAPIDLSRAPALLLIYFSYLDIKADFSGRVMERLIRHHAARGTKIRITVTGILERDKDRALLRKMAADFPNIQLQEFAWNAANGAPVGEQISVLHKTHHVKMLATRALNPRLSRVIIGGRNIHDGFLFHRPVDLTHYPNLHQYGKTNGLSLNYYSNWSDFDIEFAEPAAVDAFTAHLATHWHRDADTDLARPFSIPGKPVAHPTPGDNARHFMSIPYADGRALEDYYVELIDAAAEKIEIVNPYLNLTPELAAAIGRALDRGVKITVIGRIDLKGDFGGKFLTELNELFVEQYAGRISMFEFNAPDVVLHSKIMMIDARYVSVSSVNLNNRSFLHDSENGVAVLDPAFYARMRPVFDSYLARSNPVDPDANVGLAYRLLFSSQQVLEVF
jgi:phosphatidylserine/phosphatidylglycerophosphate/cardiolipin synthase-like enzyme